ncbi:MAG: RNB domain-containing ribonuclease [Desulfobacteraceae bacterium]|jgi:exoribonuclease-2
MNAGTVVEFIDSQKIICAVVIDIKKVRLRLLTEHNREVKLSVGRLSQISNTHLDPTVGRDKTVAALKKISAHRRDLSSHIDILSLWEILNSEQERIDLSTMTDFCFPDQPDSDHQSAVIRAFFQDRLYFKFSPEGFLPRTTDEVERIIAQRDADAIQARRIDGGANWMQKILAGNDTPAPQEADAIVEILSSYYLYEKESPYRDQAKAILNKTGGSLGSIFSFLARIGHWDIDENIELLRYGILSEIPPEIETHAQNLSRTATVIINDRRDLRHMPLITIDGPSTLDFDDALSLEKKDSHFELGIHITDVGYHVPKDDPIDRYSRNRGSSIYLPEGKISMMPSLLSEQLCSLRAGEDRPAISTLVHITPRAEILGYEIVPSLIRVDRQLTFQDADQLAEKDEAVKAMFSIALAYRERRLANGAMIIELPETNVWFDANGGGPMVATSSRETPGRLLVAELMILANELAARRLVEVQLPAIFRSQPEPRARLFNSSGGTLFQNWMQRKQIHRFLLTNAPEPHSGLGLSSYVTATSPIRKYFDLVTQRQLRAASGLEAPYTQGQIDYIINELSDIVAHVGLVQRQRHRYWLLKYLQSRIGHKEEAIVLSKRRNTYSILIPAYMLECSLSGAESIKLKPEDIIQVTIQHVNARNEVLTVYLG